MWAVFVYALRRQVGTILGWGIGLAVFGMYMVPFFDVFAKPGQGEAIENMLSMFPQELVVFFGDMTAFTDPVGFLTIEYFSYIPLILGVFAISAASALLAADEENGILDLLLSYPVSRTKFYFGRLLAFLAVLLAILLFAWLGLVIPLGSTTIAITPLEMAMPFLSMFAVLLLFSSISLLLSLLLPARGMASLISGMLLVASFFINGLAKLDDRLETIAKFSPLNYYQSGEAINGLNWNWFFGLVAVSLVFLLLAWLRFWRKDIRVAGEGSWNLPGMNLFRKPTKQT